MWYKLLTAFNKGTRFKFPINAHQIKVANGIYILFEEGEKIGSLDRVVRIGINETQGRFVERLREHFEYELQRDSVFRKHFGRCLLHLKKDPYIKYWNYDFKSALDKKRYAGLVDLKYEIPIEKEISKYIQSNCTFSVIEIADKKDRQDLEKALIATFAKCEKNLPSSNWFGSHHPMYKYFKITGLWNVHGRKGPIISEKQYAQIISSLK